MGLQRESPVMATKMAPKAPDQVCRLLIIPDHLFKMAFLTCVQVWAAIQAIHYGYPALVSLYFLIALAITVCTLQTRKLRVQDQPVRRDVMLGLIFAIALSYVRRLPSTVSWMID